MTRPLPNLPPSVANKLDKIARAANLPADALSAVTLVLRASLLEPEEEEALPSHVEVTRTQVDQGPETADIFVPTAEALRPDLGRYRELGLLGRGGAGEVWRAHDPVLDRVVALKVLRRPQARDPQTLARFRAEAQVAAALQHPYVVEVYEAGVLPDGRFYYTMEEIQGRTLREMITSAHQGPTGMPEHTLRELVRVLRDASLAVACAHDHGVIHRDLKPSNIMVERNGAVCVLDWGLFGYLEQSALGVATAELVDEELSDDFLTRDGVAGTPPYMAPEQLSGARSEHGPWTDIYALGAILFQILTGFPPVRATSMSDVARQIHSGWREPLIARHSIPEALREICEGSLAASPADRIQDATHLADALESWLAHTQEEERVQQLLREADVVLADISRGRARAASLRYTAMERGRAPDRASREALRDIWALDDEADRLEQEVEARGAVLREALRGALVREPTLMDAAARLAQLEPRHRRQGEALLSLRTEPSGAWVTLRPLSEPESPARGLGPTPLPYMAVPAGAWLLEVSAPGYHTLRLPVQVQPGERLAVPRTESAPPLPLAPLHALGPGDLLIPEGPTLVGGDPSAPNAAYLHRAYVRSFVLRARPLSCADVSPTGDPTLPLHNLSFEDARRLAAQIAEREGLPWRLPTELEWERAARGADGRAWPWGDTPDPNIAATSAAGCRGVQPLHAFPRDRSVFGVEGLGGNVADWCTTEHGEPVARGGMWAAPPNAGRCAARHRLRAPDNGLMVGLRPARSWPGP